MFVIAAKHSLSQLIHSVAVKTEIAWPVVTHSILYSLTLIKIIIYVTMLVFCTTIKKWVHGGQTPSALLQDSTDGSHLFRSQPWMRRAHPENYGSHCLGW